MSINLPESYRAYCADTAVRTAVDHIFSSEGSKKQLALPSDIEWEHLEAFHRAVLSAHQVRCEYGSFLLDLWVAIWRPALKACDFGREARSVSASQDWSGYKLDTYSLWDNRWFGRVFAIVDADFVIDLGVSVDTESAKLWLNISGMDGTDHTTGQDFGDGWPEPEFEDGYAYTSRNLAMIRDDGTIDLGPLHKAAKDALDAVSRRVQG